MGATSEWDAAEAWWNLEDLIADGSVTSVEFSRYGYARVIIDCKIRRARPVHVITGQGSAPADALREARRLYREGDE